MTTITETRLDYWMVRLAEAPKLNVLLVEDDEADARALTALFKEVGATVTWVPSGEQALPLVSEAVDLALVNLSLPGISGLEFIREMRKLRRVPCAIVTGYNPGNVQQLGVAHVFSKPFTKSNRDMLLEDFQLTTPHDYQGTGGVPAGHNPRASKAA